MTEQTQTKPLAPMQVPRGLRQYQEVVREVWDRHNIGNGRDEKLFLTEGFEDTYYHQVFGRRKAYPKPVAEIISEKVFRPAILFEEDGNLVPAEKVANLLRSEVLVYADIASKPVLLKKRGSLPVPFLYVCHPMGLVSEAGIDKPFLENFLETTLGLDQFCKEPIFDEAVKVLSGLASFIGSDLRLQYLSGSLGMRRKR